jgi:hypothetical protein
MFMVILLLYVTFVTTYEIAFVKRDKLVFDTLFIANRVVDLGFVFDLWVNFNVGFMDDEGKLILIKAAVRRRYLRGWFPLDFLALLPFGMIGFIMNNDKVKDMAFMRLIRLLRLLKLARLMKASRIIAKVMMASDLLMRQWSFIKTFVLLALFFHWSVCGLMIITEVEGADPNWQSVVLEQQGGGEAVEPSAVPSPFSSDDGSEGAGGSSSSSTSEFLSDLDGRFRFLKSGGSGGGGDSEIVVETNWYLEGAKYTLAVFGVWAFEPPQMVTRFESWYSVIMTVFAASFYAYLAGVIVELVRCVCCTLSHTRSHTLSRTLSVMGEANRETNRKLDGIMMYLEEIGYPKHQRHIYKQFFWSCRQHFLHGHYLSLLPALSPELRYPFFTCSAAMGLAARR